MVTNVRSWLRRHPQPVKLIADGREIVLSNGRKRWSDAEAAILAMKPETVEAVDEKGAVLRIMQLSPDAAVDQDDDDQPQRPASRARKNDDSELVRLAEIILEASDRGALRHADAYKAAFDKMNELTSLVLERLNGIESAWTRMLDYREQQIANAESNKPADGESVVENTLAAIVAAGAQSAQRGASSSNGKATVKE